MSRILVTGARGFIGRHLTRQLAAQGHIVCGLGHGAWPAYDAARWGVTHWINGDIEPVNLRLLQHAAGSLDVVYHLAGGSSVGAAVANPHEDFFRTVATTARLLEWLRGEGGGARLIAVSSAAVYGAGHDGPIAETAPSTPYSPYGYHKRMMEDLCRSYADSFGQRVLIARLFSVYGPGLEKQLLWDLCGKLAAPARPLVLGGSGRELRDWTHVSDVARALALLGHRPSMTGAALSVTNLGRGTGVSVGEIAEAVARAWGGTDGIDETIALRFTGQSRPGDPFSLIAQPDALTAMGFAWRVPLASGLGDYVTWYRADRRRSLA